MITRAMQRSNHGNLCIRTEEVFKFNHLITSWPPINSSIPLISYNASTGMFTIPNASLSDYLITWSVSIITSTALDGFAESILIKMKYSNGEVSEGCFSSCTTATGLMKGYKIVHVVRKSDTDTLQFQAINNGFYNDMYLTRPLYPIPTGFTENTIFNANICIMSI